MIFDPAEHPHRRFDPLADEWVLVSPHRAKRPWLGQVDTPEPQERLSHDPECFLCPGNSRVTGADNPDYRGPFVFKNDFSALHAANPRPAPSNGADSTLFQSSGAAGECRVICFSHDHSRTLPELSGEQLRAVIDCWVEQTAELGAKWRVVQLFENKGAMMGCSNPHPHGQLWASDFVPTLIATELRTQTHWLAQHGTPMLKQLIDDEIAADERIVCLNDDWVVLVPWWAKWPFETLLINRNSAQSLADLTPGERTSLASILHDITSRYDALFGVSFPYSMGWHGLPDAGDSSQRAQSGWQLHAHFYPPLLRSATVRKFMVGYELLAEAQRDMTAEQAADRLRNANGANGAPPR